MNDFILTYTGKKVRPLTPDPKTICIKDIAHHLSMICRFTGATSRFYSVAEHSVLVSWLIEERFGQEGPCLAALLHDGSEAYLSDIATPVKHTAEFEEYRYAEAVLQGTVNARFGLHPEAHLLGAIRDADYDLFTVEAKKLMRRPKGVWPRPAKLNAYPFGHTPATAERMFLNRFEEVSKWLLH